MENMHGQGTHCTKMSANSSAENNSNAPEFICPICLPKPKGSGFQWKKASLVVRSPCLDQFNLCLPFFQALCMFVQEMHYMTQNIAKALDQENTEIVEDLSERLKIYELRALTLFKDMDLSQIMDDLSCENTQHLSPASSSFDEFWNTKRIYFFKHLKELYYWKS